MKNIAALITVAFNAVSDSAELTAKTLLSAAGPFAGLMNDLAEELEKNTEFHIAKARFNSLSQLSTKFTVPKVIQELGEKGADRLDRVFTSGDVTFRVKYQVRGNGKPWVMSRTVCQTRPDAVKLADQIWEKTVDIMRVHVVKFVDEKPRETVATTEFQEPQKSEVIYLEGDEPKGVKAGLKQGTSELQEEEEEEVEIHGTQSEKTPYVVVATRSGTTPVKTYFESYRVAESMAKHYLQKLTDTGETGVVVKVMFELPTNPSQKLGLWDSEKEAAKQGATKKGTASPFNV